MITRFNRDNHVKNLPDAYCKDAKSNNNKILSLEKGTSDKLREAVAAIDNSLDLDQAYGKTLDLYGEMLGQQRGKATDAQYRILIKSRIIRNLAGGDYNSVVEAIAMTLHCEPATINLVELDEPCKVQIGDLPFDILNNLALDINTIIKIIKELIPAGVWLESAGFSGTFEFSGGTDLIYDAEAGFADVDQTIGGYLGLMFNDETAELPV